LRNPQEIIAKAQEVDAIISNPNATNAQIEEAKREAQMNFYSPILEAPGYNPVLGRGVDGFHHGVLGPPKELFLKIFSKVFKSETLSAVQALEKIDERIKSIEFQTREPRITRSFRRIQDFTGEEMLCLIKITPLIVHQLIRDQKSILLIENSKLFQNLLQVVDKENVEDWSDRAVDVATRIHTDANWNQATLNWHLIIHWEHIVFIHGKIGRYWLWVLERLIRKVKLLLSSTNNKNVQIEAMKSFEFLISAQFLLQSETRWSLNGSEPLINQSLNKIPEGKRAKLSIWEKQKLLTHKTQDDLKKVTSPTRFWLNGFRFQAKISFLEFVQDGSILVGRLQRILKVTGNTFLVVELFEKTDSFDFGFDYSHTSIQYIRRTQNSHLIPQNTVSTWIQAARVEDNLYIYEKQL